MKAVQHSVSTNQKDQIDQKAFTASSPAQAQAQARPDINSVEGIAYWLWEKHPRTSAGLLVLLGFCLGALTSLCIVLREGTHDGVPLHHQQHFARYQHLHQQ